MAVLMQQQQLLLLSFLLLMQQQGPRVPGASGQKGGPQQALPCD